MGLSPFSISDRKLLTRAGGKNLARIVMLYHLIDSTWELLLLLAYQSRLGVVIGWEVLPARANVRIQPQKPRNLDGTSFFYTF